MDNSTDNYQPAPQVLDRLAQVDFVAIIGPTAVGKSTLIKSAMQRDPDIHLVLVNTSRQPRTGEQDGVDYLFKTRPEMEAVIGRREYVQVAPSVLSELYATAPENYPTSGVAVMAVLAQAIPAFRALPFKTNRSLFILPPSWPEWQQRLVKHGFTTDHRLKRLAEAKRSLEFALTDTNTALLVNDDLARATALFCDYVAHHQVTALLAEKSRARQVATDLLGELEKQLN